MENWKDIPGYEGIYEASTLGRIRSKEGKTTKTERSGIRHWKQRIMKQKICRNAKGRTDAKVDLWSNGKRRTFLVSRLVAMTWVAGYAPELTVNHRDGNTTNNMADNLEWASRADNIRQGFKDGLYSTSHSVGLKTGNAVLRYRSLSEASRSIGRSHSYLSGCLKKRRPITDINGNVHELYRREGGEET